MDASDLLAQFVIVMCAVAIYRYVRFSVRLTLGWIGVSAALIVLTVLLRASRPDVAGMVAAGAWGVFVLLPMTLQRRLDARVAQGRHDRAARIASAARWLHPLDGWWSLPALHSALARIRAGDVSGGTAALAKLERHPVHGGTARFHRHLASCDWQGLVTWFASPEGAAARRRDPRLELSRLRALGEVGDTGAMLAAFERRRGSFIRIGAGYARAARLLVLAFAGRFDALEALFSGPLSDVAESERRAWLILAALTRGDAAAARSLVAEAPQCVPSAVRERWLRRIEAPPVAASAVDESGEALLDRIASEIADEERFRITSRSSFNRARITHVVLALNLLVFVVEIVAGGSTDPETLIRLGALDTERVAAGAWHRLFVAGVLHLGWLHLTLNMGALAVFGPFVERTLGRLRFAALIVATSVGSMAVVTAIAFITGERAIVVGASGGIMGLCGAALVVMAVGWRRDGARAARMRLVALLAMVAAQTVFDFVTPAVSGLAHGAGLVLGLGLGSVLVPRRVRRA